MYVRYSDILSRISDEPVWWLDGVPRFSPFKPDDVCVYSADTILVHTECQGCRKRYDVAVHGAFLREKIAYMSSLDLADPPNACCRVGPTMSSDEIKILEYWKPVPFPKRGWERVPEWERHLVDANFDNDLHHSEPVFRRLYDSSQEPEWRMAVRNGNFPLMVKMLKEVGCELPVSVAHMLDAERRRDQLGDTLVQLWRARKVEQSGSSSK
jgi:hypothetical protein